MKNVIKSLYMHFPYCLHLCNYCDFHRQQWAKGDGFSNFEKLLDQTWVEHQRLLEQYQQQLLPLKTLYIGGGTPSVWGKSGASYMKKLVDEKIPLDDGYEFTIEVNPGGYENDDMHAWLDAGVNRFSVGLQTLNSEVLPLLDRMHTLDQSYQTMELFHGLGVNYSVDLIFILILQMFLAIDIKMVIPYSHGSHILIIKIRIRRWNCT